MLTIKFVEYRHKMAMEQLTFRSKNDIMYLSI